MFPCFSSATNPAKVKLRKPLVNMFETNPEGKLVIAEEGEREGQGGGTEQEVENEEMDVDEVWPVNYYNVYTMTA